MRIGILGGGQLGRMLALAGLPLGLDFRFLEHRDPCPVDELGELVRAHYDDLEAVRRFGEGLDAVTYEFENVPAQSAALLAETLPVYPPPAALALAGDRLNEKEGFERLGIPCAPWRRVDSREELDAAVGELGFPCVLKTRRLGYDGKGQAVLRDEQGVDDAWGRLGDRPLILEGFVAFARELSIVSVRGRDGAVACYPLVENAHEMGVLVRTTAPAPEVDPALQARAEGYARALLEELEYVGVMSLELFQVGGRLLANEVAPRVHNSGHWTQDGAAISQFENHVRAVAGLPLGSTEPVGFSEMVNLLGVLPAPADLLREPLAHLHLYAKGERPGRKIGHVNVCGPDRAGVQAAARGIVARLPEGAGPV
jgi:5-(carboxyamino)imidazole ribonucleotide synthase